MLCCYSLLLLELYYRSNGDVKRKQLTVDRHTLAGVVINSICCTAFDVGTYQVPYDTWSFCVRERNGLTIMFTFGVSIPLPFPGQKRLAFHRVHFIERNTASEIILQRRPNVRCKPRAEHDVTVHWGL